VTYSVYQHWDPLTMCVVGRSYPPEFYSWIKVPHVRNLFEKIAIETEEDYQHIIKKLQEFNVEVLRPNLPEETFINNQYVAPPMNPRDHTVMIGEKFYIDNYFLKTLGIKNCYNDIFNHIQEQQNQIIEHMPSTVNGAMVSRIGKDLYFSTEWRMPDTTELKNTIDKEFTTTRNHVVNTAGHGDATYCPVCPGLIISLLDIPTYADTFPGWEVVYLPNQSWKAIAPFLELKKQNSGKWWIPGFEQDQAVIDTVEQWLGHWTGYVEETVFDVNMLIINPTNVIVFNYNKQVFDALDRYGITAHIVPFRHRYFWDGGIHCVTSDLNRSGNMQDFFPKRD